MTLSANTLFHFTSNKTSLKKILEKNFKINYCREQMFFNETLATLHVPMVSFCDIPLSEIKNHILIYGNYGIGLTKEWGIRNGLNPVFYIEKNSLISKSYFSAVRNYVLNTTKRNSDLDENQKSLLDILRYTKNYAGSVVLKNGKKKDDYRFSDEREWRFVPHYKDDNYMIINDKIYKKNVVDIKNQITKLSVCFEPSDIRYIIIRDDKEIPEFISHLQNVKGKNYTAEDVARLTTRILTSEQIKADM
jgi:hypothetical protein